MLRQTYLRKSATFAVNWKITATAGEKKLLVARISVTLQTSFIHRLNILPSFSLALFFSLIIYRLIFTYRLFEFTVACRITIALISNFPLSRLICSLNHSRDRSLSRAREIRCVEKVIKNYQNLSCVISGWKLLDHKQKNFRPLIVYFNCVNYIIGALDNW